MIVYLFLLLAFRVAGKRELGQMTPFDLIVLLAISNVLQNAMIGNDNSLGGGLVGAATLFVLNGLFARATFHFPRLARLVEGEPTTLIENGRIVQPNLRHEVMTLEELQRALRKHELDWRDLPRIEHAQLELDGRKTSATNQSNLVCLSARSIAAPTNSRNRGCGRSGRDLSSG
jgi:uncharacterized membrane protein YcaP (DUF421 family)